MKSDKCNMQNVPPLTHSPTHPVIPSPSPPEEPTEER